MERSLRAMHKLNRWMRLPDQERWLVIEACFFMVCAKLATFTTSTRTLLGLGALDLASGVSLEVLAGCPAEIACAVVALDKSSRRLFFANCLVRALALRILLARRDIPTELHIGARKDQLGKFTAHAWLTFQETILIGGDDAKELYRELVGSSHGLI